MLSISDQSRLASQIARGLNVLSTDSHVILEAKDVLNQISETNHIEIHPITCALVGHLMSVFAANTFLTRTRLTSRDLYNDIAKELGVSGELVSNVSCYFTRYRSMSSVTSLLKEGLLPEDRASCTLC